jgi:multidrug resistance efflux pump
MKLRILTGSILVFLLMLNLSGCLSTRFKDGPIVTTALAQGNTPIPVTVEGIIASNNNITLVPKIPGRVATVNVEIGQEVHQGDILLQLEDLDIRNQVKQAEAGLAAAKARLSEAKAGARPQELATVRNNLSTAAKNYEVTKLNYERTKTLFDQGAVPQQQLESVEILFTKAQNDYASAKEQLSLAEAGAKPQTVEALEAAVQQAAVTLASADSQLDNTILRAPINGQISMRNLDPGEMASPSLPAFSLIDTSAVNLECFVAQEVVNLVKTGTSAIVTTSALPGRTFQGKVTAVSPAASMGGQRFPLKLTITNPIKELKPGMPAVAEIQLNGAVVVSDKAIVAKRGKYYVFRLEKDIVRQVEVQVGVAGGGLTEVVNGLAAGQTVVAGGAQSLVDGQQVKTKS